MKSVFALFSFFACTVAVAGPEHKMPAPKVAPEFEKMKELVGTWEGTSNMEGKEMPVKVTYELTSNGTALMERLGPGTPHEMLTVYSSRGKQVSVTHYCGLGNQPEMKLKKAEGSMFAFEMDGTKGISSKNEMHMHSVKLSLNGDKLKAEWMNYKDGKKGDTAVFEFTKTAAK